MSASTRQHAGLEVIRALAAIIVVYNHVFTFGLIPKTGILELPAQYATEAVIIFFVLSGAVITLSAEKKYDKEPSRFAVLRNYSQARLFRIYPIYVFGLGLAFICKVLIDHSWMTMQHFLGNLFFLQTQAGYIVSSPRYNPPLWSLSNEIFYYFLFAISFYWKRIIIIWAGLATSCAIFLYPPNFGGISAHIVYMLSLSLPWIMGHLIAAKRNQLPEISIPLGFAFFIIGLSYARIPLTSEYYDAFRLTAFGACCCPLILSLVQPHPEGIDHLEYRGCRITLSLIGIVALWSLSPSLFYVKFALTILSIIFSTLSTNRIQAGLECFRIFISPLLYVGSISYGVYVLHAPLLFLTNDLLGETPIALKFAVFGVSTFTLSHVLERWVQPRLSANRAPPRPQTQLGST